MADFQLNLGRDVGATIAANTNKELKKAMMKYVASKASPNQKMRKKIKTVNQKAGKAAQAAMVQQYLAKASGRPSYRVGDPGKTGRYAGGKLLTALSSPSNLKLRGTTFSFFDRGFMDSTAPQWNRLSFGAGTGANNQITPMKMPTSGKIIGPSIITSTQGGDSFSIPGSGRGAFFFKGGATGGMQLHVTRRSATQGFSQSSPRSRFKLNRPIDGRVIHPMGFVQAGVSAANAIYPKLLVRAVKVYLKPDNPGTRV